LISAIASIAACGGSGSADGAVAGADAGPDVLVTSPGRAREAGADEPFDAGSPRWCNEQGQHTFCADFDGISLLDGWEWGGSNLAFKGVNSERSAPRALSITEAASSHDAGEYPDAPAFSKSVALTSPTSLHVGVDIEVESLGLVGDSIGVTPIMIALTHVEGTSTSYALAAQLSLRATKAEVTLWGTSASGAPFDPQGGGDLPSLPIAAWVRVELDLAVTPSGGTVTVTYDGKSVGHFDIAGIATTALNGAYLELGGLHPQFHPGDFVASFDNVLADAH
jgi:hypothetical protein